MLKTRFEEINDYDIQRGINQTIKRLAENIQKNLEIIEEIDNDPELVKRLALDIENDRSELVYISSSMVFGRDIVILLEKSSVYKKPRRRKR